MITDNIIRFFRVYGAKIQEHLGKLYVISSDKASFDEMCTNSFSPASQEDRNIPIKPCLIENLSEIKDEPLRNVIEESGANLACAALDSEQGAPSFLLMHASEDALFDEADLFAFKEDKFNRDALSDMMQNMAVNDPKRCRAFMSTVQLHTPGLGITRGGRKTAVQKKEDLERYKGNFVNNMKIVRSPDKYSVDEVNRANYEVRVVLSSVPQASLVELMRIIFTTHKIPKSDVINDCFLNLDSAAEKSDIQLDISCYKNGKKKAINSDGMYRLTFKKGENDPNPKFIRFPGKVETAIFYTVLVARKTTDARKIEILDLEKEFIGIYRALYRVGYDEAQLAFDSIKDYEFKDADGKLIKRYQGRYRNYIPNIRAAIDAALGGIVDNPAVFYYDYSYRKGGTFYVKEKRITLAQDFSNEIVKYQNKEASVLD